MSAVERISLRDALSEREGAGAPRDGECFYCRRYATRLEYDHFPIPHMFGGELVVPACLTCHDLKDRKSILDWPAEHLREAFDGLTPQAALLVGCVLRSALRVSEERRRAART